MLGSLLITFFLCVQIPDEVTFVFFHFDLIRWTFIQRQSFTVDYVFPTKGSLSSLFNYHQAPWWFQYCRLFSVSTRNGEYFHPINSKAYENDRGMIDGCRTDIALADADMSVYKLSVRPAETIRRPRRPNDAWEVIKQGSWKLVSFFIPQKTFQLMTDCSRGTAECRETASAATLPFREGVSLLCTYTFIKKTFHSTELYICWCVYAGFIKSLC